MNYIGSKTSLIDFIDRGVEQVTQGNYQTVCDIFAGTGAVGKHFKVKGKKVIANDLQYYSYVLNRHYIGNHRKLLFANLQEEVSDLAASSEPVKKVCEFLERQIGEEGFIYKNYCLEGSGERQYFSDENGKRCDAVRAKVEAWHRQEKINNDEYYFLLTTLIEAMDKVANTASVYGAFLKGLKKTAQKKMVLAPAELLVNDQEHEVYNRDANELIKEIVMDVLYLDPPYNQRQYATNYHLLETIARYDSPEIHGKTGLREYAEQKSKYCSRNQVKQVFADLIENAKAKYIFLSYNNEGLMSLEDIKEIMSRRGEYGVFTQKYRRFKADNKRKYIDDTTTEYLHYVVCRD